MKNIFRMKMLVSVLIIIAAVVMGIYGWTILPDMVATQPERFATGAPMVHKFGAVGIPSALMVVFGYLGQQESKLFLGSLIGVGMHILFWLTN